MTIQEVCNNLKERYNNLSRKEIVKACRDILSNFPTVTEVDYEIWDRKDIPNISGCADIYLFITTTEEEYTLEIETTELGNDRVKINRVTLIPRVILF